MPSDGSGIPAPLRGFLVVQERMLTYVGEAYGSDSGPAGGVVLGGVGAAGFWQYHEQPQFCATCHIMEPYLES